MFYLKDKSRARSAIVAIVRHKGQRYKFSTGESVIVDYWLPAKERCSAGSKYPEGAYINEKLDQIRIDVQSLLHEFNLENHIPTQDEFMERLKGKKQEENLEKQPYFSEYIHNYLEEAQKDRAISTLKKYRTTLNKILEYEEDRKMQLRFEDINIYFYRDFRKWFYSKYNTRNYFGSIVKNIKRFMNMSMLDGIHKCDGHKHPEFKIEHEDADTVYLSMDELKKIHEMEITDEVVKHFYPNIRPQNLARKKESMEKVRNRFLIGAFTMLRVSDFKRLTETNIHSGFIKIKPKKRSKGRKNRDVVIPMHPIVKEILQKGIDLSEIVSEQKINKHIKEICKFAGIDDEEIIIRTERGEEVERTYKKWKLITTHTARRSAATNMLMAGMEASDIMILGGWSSEKSFWKYIRMEPEVNARRLADHPFFR